MMVASVVVLLYFWGVVGGKGSLGSLPAISVIAAISSGVALLVSGAAYLWTPPKYEFWGSYASFIALSSMSMTLFLTSGELLSPYIAVWMFVALFAAVFGYYGIIPLFLAISASILTQLFGGSIHHDQLVVFLLCGELPLVLSYILWHSQTATDTSGDKAYRELATQLSQVAGKSEVVINAIADGVIALNNQGVIQLINPAAQQIIGWGKQDALALSYKSVLKLVDKSDKELEQTNDPISQAIATNKEVRSTNFNLMTNSGKKLLVSIVVSPIGQPGSGVIIVFRDITKEKAEEREQAEFISTASHEMRTPVASIEGYLGLALNPATAQIDEKARDFITKAHESAQHLGRLFQDLLDVSKAEDGRMSNNPKVVDIVVFTHDIVQGLRHKAEEKGLRILFKPQPDDDDPQSRERHLNPVFYSNVDNDHLGEVLSNLVENAIKYTPKGDVVVDVTGDAEHVVISVADSGIGIPKEDQVHLFQKFYRVDNSDTREIGGTGLGLYLSRRLAEAMNGRIWLDSEYKKGSTFYLELPRIDHEEATRLIEQASLTPIENEISDVTVNQPTLVNAPTPAQTPVIPTPEIVPDQQQALPGEAIYTSAPASAVAQQLQSMGAGSMQQGIQPLQRQQVNYTPVQPTSYTPAQPQQTYPGYVSGQPAYAPPPQPAQHPNTPISSIEQHPDQYVRPRQPSVSVPPRGQN